MKHGNHRRRGFHNTVTCLTVTLSLGVTTTPVVAGIPVADGVNLIENAISAIQSVQQTIRQARMLENQVREIQSWDPNMYTWESVQDVLDNLTNITRKVEYFDNTVRDINAYLEKFQDIAYYEKSPCFTNQGCSDAEREVMEENKRKASENQKEANRATFEMLQVQKDRLQADARSLEEQRLYASSAKDQKAILAHANQFALDQSKQLMQIRALLVAQQEAVTAEMLKKSDEESKKSAASKNFLKGKFVESTKRGW